MGHLATSKVIEEIIIEFRRKGLHVSQRVLIDLKSARTLMKVGDADQKSLCEASRKIDDYLSSVEAHLITEAQKNLTPEEVNDWLRRLDAARYDACFNEAENREVTQFVIGVPRDQKWIRVKPLPELPIDELEKLARNMALSSRREVDGHLTVYGSAENLRFFIQKMTRQTAREK